MQVRHRCAIALVGALILGGIVSVAAAAPATTIVPDTTAGLSVGTTLSSSGSSYTIDHGTLVGSTLFHSFSQFDLGLGDTAKWIYSPGGGASIAAVINRVTGGSASNINGTISSSGLPNASFYFINPAGIVFGAAAQVNVPNAVYFSTASELRFSDGAKFSAVTPSGSVLTSAAPTAFGFLGGEGDLALGGLFDHKSSLVSLSAANISDTVDAYQDLNGSVDFIAIGNQSAIVPIGDPLSSGTLSGNVNLSGTTYLFGNVRVGAGQFLLTGILETDDTATSASGDIIVKADTVVLDGTDGFLSTGGGEISITSRSLRVANGAGIDTGTFNSELPSGNIVIHAGSLEVLGGSYIDSSSYTGGDGGDISIDASSILLSDAAFVGSNPDAQGNAGSISIRAATVDINSFATIDTSSYGAGRGGDISIESGSLTLSDSGSIGSFAEDIGNAGNISVHAATVDISGGGSIDTTSDWVGRGGNITINAGSITLSDSGSIRSDSNFYGDAGDILIQATNVAINSGGNIDTTSIGPGRGGDIAINADSVRLSDSGSVTSYAEDAGDAGDVSIHGATVDLLSGSFINTTTYSSGRGGGITIDAGTLNVASTDPLNPSNIRASAAGSGYAGDIFINATTFKLETEAIVTTLSSGSGKSGNITIVAHAVTLTSSDPPSLGPTDTNRRGVIVSAEAQGAGNAGNISITADSVSDSGASEIGTSTFFGTERGGNINIQSNSVTLTGPSIIVAETFDSGGAGNITINANTIDLSSGSAIETSAFSSGNAGDLTITAGTVTVSSNSLIGAQTVTSGHGGVIDIGATSVNLASGGRISTSALSVGQAGDITIDANNINVGASSSQQTSGIFSRGLQNGIAGDIALTSDMVTLSDGGTINTDSANGPAGDISLSMSANGILVLEGANARGLVSTSSGTNTGGRIYIAAPGAIVMNGGAIQALGPSNQASATINAGAIIQSTDRLNNIAVAGTLVLDSAVVDVGAAVTAADLFFVDELKILSGQCAAQHAGASISQLSTISAGPYVPISVPSSADNASIAPSLGECGSAMVADAGDTRVPFSGVPAAVAPQNGSTAPGQDDGGAFAPVSLAQGTLRPRTGPNSGTSTVPGFAAPAPQTGIAPSGTTPLPLTVPSGDGIVLSDVEVLSKSEPFLARPSAHWQPEAGQQLSLDIAPGESLDAAWVKRQFVRNGLIGAKISIDRIVQLQLLINQAYIQNGYINSGLLLHSPLPAGKGVLVLELVAGRVVPHGSDNIAPNVRWSAAGAQGLGENYVRERLPAAVAVPFNAFNLERDFRLLADDPAIRTVNASLQPGSRPGEADLTVLVDPVPWVDAYATVSDSRSPSVGGYRAAIGGSFRNTFFSGDLVSGEIGVTEGLVDLTFDYATPIMSPDWLFDVRGEADRAAVVDPGLRALHIHSKELTIDGGLSYNLIDKPLSPTEEQAQWSPAQRLTVGVRVAYRTSDSYLLGMPFSFSPGAVNGITQFTVLRGTVDWSQRNVDQVWGVSATASFGLEGTGSDIAGIATPAPNFKAVLARANFAQRLNDNDLELKIAAAGQWSSGLLYSAERFAAGGAGSVSGYRNNLLLADKGAFGSVELSCPFDLTGFCTRHAREQGSFKLAIFTAAAVVSNDVAPQPAPKWIASVGVGLAWTPVSYIRADISYAKSLIPPVIVGQHDLQDDGVNFQVTLRPIELIEAEF